MSDLSGLDKAHEVMRRKREAGIAIIRLNPIQKAQANPKSKKWAIAGKCFDCVGQDADAGWRRRIGDCTITDCALWLHRPYQTGDEEEDNASESEIE